jgi:hypothetical protein
MRQSRRRAKPRSDLGVAPDVATDTTSNTQRPPRGNRYAKMKLPHERDESAHTPGEPDPVTTQAARDVEQGQRDTDCYEAAGQQFDRNTKP